MCPNCTSNDCRRSRLQNVLERAFSWIGIHPFRCQECQVRFWKVGDQLRIHDDRAPLIFYFTIFAAYVSPHVIDLIAASKKTIKTSLSASYALRFYLYLFVVGVIVTVIAVRLRPYGLLANIAFAIIAGYLAIKIGRRVLGRKHL